ncbi:MAG: hypothetical protein ABIT68_05975 [Sphingomicrobium sp.]
MGVAGSDMHAAEQPAVGDLLNGFTTIDDAARRRHADVLAYWLSIRGDREFPPLHDLDPLAISDASPCSALLELIGGGEDAEVRHLGETLKADGAVERIIDAPAPSILASIARKLSIVAISRNALTFEDQFPAADSITHCWVTLLPLSSAGAWVDYVYAFVTSETVPASVAEATESSPDGAEAPEFVANEVEEVTAIPSIDEPQAEEASIEAEQESEPMPDSDQAAPAEPHIDAETDTSAEPSPGFSDILQTSTNADGFYGAQTVKRVPVRSAAPFASSATSAAPSAPPAMEPLAESTGAAGESLQARLVAVRAKADEARMAKLMSNAALYEGLGAAYDFALDAENCPEEYLKLVETQGLKIQLRQPMKPVMKLAFAGMCDDATITRLEAVLAWALEQELPRGTLAAQIEAVGGISRIVGGAAPE